MSFSRPHMSEINAHNMAAYLRVASIAVALYDYLETMPTAWKFYKENWRTRRWRDSSLLFMCLRITSITVLTVSNIGFFYGHFTQSLCNRFFLVPPIFKVLQGMITESILGLRAFNLSQRSRIVGGLLLGGYLVACVLQWITTVHQRQGVVHPFYHNCRAASNNQGLGAWLFYAVAMIYDLATTLVSVFFLLKYKFSSSTNSMMSHLINMMLSDGLGYFLVLTAVNILNLILYRSSPDVQTAAASLGYCVSWIMSQRLLIHLYAAYCERRNDSMDGAITITRNIDSARQVSHAMRTQFEQKSGAPFELTVPDFESDIHSVYPHMDDPEEHVQVTVEHTVTVNQTRSRRYQLEDYSRSGREAQSRA